MTVWSDFPLWQRLELARRQLAPVASDYRVVFELDLDSPAAVLIPDPHWMACALEGGILPPVQTYHALKRDENGALCNGHILHEAPPIAALSEQEAIEYLIQKDIPAAVWETRQGNALRLVICRKDQLPTQRIWRDAWKIKQERGS